MGLTKYIEGRVRCGRTCNVVNERKVSLTFDNGLH